MKNNRNQSQSPGAQHSEPVWKTFGCGSSSSSFSSLILQSQRDCDLQPRVARNELPWVAAPSVSNPDGVASAFQGLLRFVENLGLDDLIVSKETYRERDRADWLWLRGLKEKQQRS